MTTASQMVQDIKREEKRPERKAWVAEGRKIYRRYRAEKPTDNTEAVITDKGRINMLWSNVQTLTPALFYKNPEVVVNSRFSDVGPSKPLVNQASKVLERALSYCIDEYNFSGVVRRSVEDRLLPGAAFAKVRYQPYFEEISERITVAQGDAFGDDATGAMALGQLLGQLGDPDTLQYDDDTGDLYIEETSEQVVYEEAVAEYWYWEDVIWGWAREWSQVPWVAFKTYYTEDQAVKEWGPEVASTLTYSHQDLPDGQRKGSDSYTGAGDGKAVQRRLPACGCDRNRWRRALCRSGGPGLSR